MKNIDFVNATPEQLAAAGYKVKGLKRRDARKGETHFTGNERPQGAGRVNPNLTQTNGGTRGQAATGGRWVGNQCGIGASGVRNLDQVKKAYAAQVKRDRREQVLNG